MKMRMEEQVLSPGMQDGCKPDFSAKVLWVFRKGQESLRGSLKQEMVKDSPVQQDEVVQGFRKCEDDMKIGDRKEFLATLLKPLLFGHGLALGTMPVSTGVIADRLVTTVVALIEMATQKSGATNLDGVHHLPLFGAENTSELLVESFSVSPKDVRHLRTVTWHSANGEAIANQGIERTADLGNLMDGNVGVDGSCRDTPVSKE